MVALAIEFQVRLKILVQFKNKALLKQNGTTVTLFPGAAQG